MEKYLRDNLDFPGDNWKFLGERLDLLRDSGFNIPMPLSYMSDRSHYVRTIFNYLPKRSCPLPMPQS